MLKKIVNLRIKIYQIRLVNLSMYILLISIIYQKSKQTAFSLQLFTKKDISFEILSQIVCALWT